MSSFLETLSREKFYSALLKEDLQWRLTDELSRLSCPSSAAGLYPSGGKYLHHPRIKTTLGSCSLPLELLHMEIMNCLQKY